METLLEEKLTAKLEEVGVPAGISVDTGSSLVLVGKDINGYYDRELDHITIYIKDYSLSWESILAVTAHEAGHSTYDNRCGYIGKGKKVPPQVMGEAKAWIEGYVIAKEWGVGKKYLEYFSSIYMSLFNEANTAVAKKIEDGISKTTAIVLLEMFSIAYRFPIPLPDLPINVQDWLFRQIEKEDKEEWRK